MQEFSQPTAEELVWRLHLPPGAEQPLTASWVLEWPQGRQIVSAVQRAGGSNDDGMHAQRRRRLMTKKSGVIRQ